MAVLFGRGIEIALGRNGLSFFSVYGGFAHFFFEINIKFLGDAAGA